MASGNIPLFARVKIDSLWTNSAPSSNFAAKNVSVDLTGYDFYGVICRFGVSYNRLLPMGIFRVDENLNQISEVALGTNQVGARCFSYSAANHWIAFETGHWNGSASTAYVIPVEIVGIKV